MYLSEIRDQQWELEQALRDRLADDSQLRDALERYKTKARTAPHGITHFDLRYPSFASLERVIDRLTDQLDPRLEGRVAVDAIRPGDARSMTDELIQGFVTTDVISAGLFTFGQLIELHAQELEG